jgi:hypothetical protein
VITMAHRKIRNFDIAQELSCASTGAGRSP